MNTMIEFQTITLWALAACLVPMQSQAQDAPAEEPGEVVDDAAPSKSPEGDTDSQRPTEPTEPAAPSYEGVLLPEEDPTPAPTPTAPATPAAPVPPTVSAVPKPPPAPATEPPAPTAAITTPSQAPAPAPEEYRQPTLMADEPGELDEPEEDKHNFSWFSLSPQFGYTFFPAAKLTVNDLSATVQPRNGFIAKVHMDMGGDGIAFELAPLFSLQAGGIDASGGDFGNVNVDVSSLKGSFQAVGIQMGLVYRFQIGQFYPHLGLGLHSSYLMGDDLEFGAELYGRIPIGCTVYLAKHIALTVEFGFMFGVTGIKQSVDLTSMDAFSEMNLTADQEIALDQLNSIKSESDLEEWYNANSSWVDSAASQANAQNPNNDITSESLLQDAAMDALADAIRFGKGIGLDFMIGIRFP